MTHLLHAFVLILLAAGLLAPPFLILRYSPFRWVRGAALVALAGLGLFALFGFLASYELTSDAERLPWQIGYAALGLACVCGPVALLRNGSGAKPAKDTEKAR